MHVITDFLAVSLVGVPEAPVFALPLRVHDYTLPETYTYSDFLSERIYNTRLYYPDVSVTRLKCVNTCYPGDMGVQDVGA